MTTMTGVKNRVVILRQAAKDTDRKVQEALQEALDAQNVRGWRLVSTTTVGEGTLGNPGRVYLFFEKVTADG